MMANPNVREVVETTIRQRSRKGKSFRADAAERVIEAYEVFMRQPPPLDCRATYIVDFLAEAIRYQEINEDCYPPLWVEAA